METTVKGPLPGWARGLLILGLAYVFLSSINMMGQGFELIGTPFSHNLTKLTTNPMAGLMAGVMATAIIQSSTLVTNLIVGLVAAGTIQFELAVPMVMGANVGTTLTCVLVSLGYVGRRGRFRRAFAAATMHDFFNILTVCILFPLEVTTHILSRSAYWLAEEFSVATHFTSPNSPLTLGLSLVKMSARYILKDLFGLGDMAAGIVMAALALALLFVSLYYLTVTMRFFLSGTLEKVLDRYLFRGPGVALAAGFVVTALIHSSSVTTSLTVPLIAAGVLTMERVFPYTLGANIGTTTTALLGALATGQTAGLAIALTHTLFNCIGVAIFFPIEKIRGIPIYLARALAALTLRSRWYALLYVAAVFFIIPVLFILAWK